MPGAVLVTAGRRASPPSQIEHLDHICTLRSVPVERNAGAWVGKAEAPMEL